MPAISARWQDNMASGAGYEGTDEYTPAGADASVTSKEARRVIVDGPSARPQFMFLNGTRSRDVYRGDVRSCEACAPLV